MNKPVIPLVLIVLLAFITAGCNEQKETTPSRAEIVPSPVIENLIPFFVVKAEAEALRSPLYLSHDFGDTWEGIGHNLPEDTQVSFLEWYGDDILIATDNAGLYLSQNNRASWRQIGIALPGKKINALFVSAQDIFVSVYGYGIFRSTDTGASWEEMNYNLPKRNLQSILVGDALLVGSDVGIYRLDAAKKHWQLISDPVQVLSLATRSGHLVAGTSQGTLYSGDDGATWQWVHREDAVHYTRIVGNRIVEMCLYGDLFLSSDWGNRWTKTNYAPRQGSYVYEAAEVGGYLIMSNNYGIHRSTDGGLNWKLVYQTEEMIFFDFLVKGDVLYGGTRTWDEYRGRE